MQEGAGNRIVPEAVQAMALMGAHHHQIGLGLDGHVQQGNIGAAPIGLDADLDLIFPEYPSTSSRS